MPCSPSPSPSELRHIQNKREQASKLLVPYNVAGRQCAKDADPAQVRG